MTAKKDFSATKLTKEQKDLIGNNLGLIRSFVYKRYARESYEIKQELISEGIAIICERINDFDISKGRYSTHVYNVLGFALRNYYSNKLVPIMRQEVALKTANEDMDRELSTRGVSERKMFANHMSDEMFLDKSFDNYEIKEKFEKLEVIDQKLIDAFVIKEMSIKEISEEMQISPKGLYYLKNKALANFKNLFTEREISELRHKERRF